MAGKGFHGEGEPQRNVEASVGEKMALECSKEGRKECDKVCNTQQLLGRVQRDVVAMLMEARLLKE